MKLNQKNVAGLALPPDKLEKRFFDDDLPGFGLRLRAGGKRTWIVQYRSAGGKNQTLTIGDAAVLDASPARQEAKQRLANITLGGDPQAEKAEQRARAALTFGAVATRFLDAARRKIENGDDKALKPRSLESVEGHLAKHWAPFNSLPIHSIERRNVAARLGEIAAERGLYAGNRARSTLSVLFTWAIGEGLVDTNPVLGTNKPMEKEPPRERVLEPAELVAAWNACRDDDYGRIVRLLVLTGQRRDEIGSIGKSEISVGARCWNIPRERTKNSRAHEVPLPDLAIEILKPAMLREGREDRDLIFGDGLRAFSGWSKAKLSLDRRIEQATGTKPEPWRLHDLRRTAATRMVDLGVLPHVVEAVLNHVSGHKAGVAGVYNRALYAPEKRRALDLWAAHIEALLAGKLASNVIPMNLKA
jgi:integrase